MQKIIFCYWKKQKIPKVPSSGKERQRDTAMRDQGQDFKCKRPIFETAGSRLPMAFTTGQPTMLDLVVGRENNRRQIEMLKLMARCFLPELGICSFFFVFFLIESESTYFFKPIPCNLSYSCSRRSGPDLFKNQNLGFIFFQFSILYLSNFPILN